MENDLNVELDLSVAENNDEVSQLNLENDNDNIEIDQLNLDGIDSDEGIGQLDLNETSNKEDNEELTLEKTTSIEDKYTVFTEKQAQELQEKQRIDLEKTLDDTLKFIALVRVTQKWNIYVANINKAMKQCEDIYERLEKDNLTLYQRESRERQALMNAYHDEHHPQIVRYDKYRLARCANYKKRFQENLNKYKNLKQMKNGKDVFIKQYSQQLYKQLQSSNIKLITDLDLAGTNIDEVLLPSLTSASFTCAKCGETVTLSSKTDNIYNPTNTLLLLIESTYKIGNATINLYDFESRLVIPYNVCRKCGQVHVFPISIYERAREIFKHHTDIIHNYHLDKKTQCNALHKSRNKNDEIKESDKLILQSLASDYIVSILINSYCYDGVLKFKVKGKQQEKSKPRSLKNIHACEYTPHKAKEVSSYERLTTKVNNCCDLDDVKDMSLEDIESLDFGIDTTSIEKDEPIKEPVNLSIISDEVLAKAINQADIKNMDRDLIEVEDDIAYERYNIRNIDDLSEDELLAPYKFFNNHTLRLLYLQEDIDGEVCETSTLEEVSDTIREILSSGNESFSKDLRILPSIIQEELSLYDHDDELDSESSLGGVIDIEDLRNQENENDEFSNIGEFYED